MTSLRPTLPLGSAPVVADPAVVAGRSTDPGRPAPVTHAHYRREPYVRCRTPTAVVDGKAAAWTRTQVLLHWIDDVGRVHNRWVPAETVHRIPRDDSCWQDPYDDWSFYYPAGFSTAVRFLAGTADHPVPTATSAHVLDFAGGRSAHGVTGRARRGQ